MLWTKKQVPPWVPGLDPQFRVFLFTSDKAGTNLKRMRMKQPELLQGGGLSIHRLCQAHRAFTGFSKTICLVPGRLLGALARFCVSLGTEDGVLIVEVGNSDRHMAALWPDVPFLWFEFERGGHGVFMLDRRQLLEFRDRFIAA